MKIPTKAEVLALITCSGTYDSPQKKKKSSLLMMNLHLNVFWAKSIKILHGVWVIYFCFFFFKEQNEAIFPFF